MFILSAIVDDDEAKEPGRIVRELHETLFQGFPASMLLDQAAEQAPADSPTKQALSHTLRLVRRAVDEGRAVLQGLHPTSPAASSVEQTFSNLVSEVRIGRSVRLRILVQEKSRTLAPAIQEQLFMIGRKAVTNALRHSGATKIEVEVQYFRTLLIVLVRDNGCGIDLGAVRKESDSHWGLRGMRHRAEDIGARFGIWSGPGAGTEVHVAVPVDASKRQPMIAGREGARYDERQLHPSLERR